MIFLVDGVYGVSYVYVFGLFIFLKKFMFLMTLRKVLESFNLFSDGTRMSYCLQNPNNFIDVVSKIPVNYYFFFILVSFLPIHAIVLRMCYCRC